MAAKYKKRLCKNENKLLKLDKLQLSDVICPICQSILVEPVTLPCFHDFCKVCFNGTVENNALCCPICRLRIGSWLRTATKRNNLVNVQFWNFLQSKFSDQLEAKSKGDDVEVPQELPSLRLSDPGEIRSEYEAELKRLRKERQQLEEKHLQETELLIKKLQEEEEEAHRKYLEIVKKDELLAQTIQESTSRLRTLPPSFSQPHNNKLHITPSKSKLKSATLDTFIVKKPIPKQASPQLTDDNSSTTTSTPKCIETKPHQGSPELIPTYSKLIKKYLDSKCEPSTSKDFGESSKSFYTQLKSNGKCKMSLPVSLPYTGILQHKRVQENKNTETGSVDSMRQELCYFKPIEGTNPTSLEDSKSVPVRVPGVRGVRGDRENQPASLETAREAAPSRNQYLEALCRLRNISLAQNLPSAFVIALTMLRVKKECPSKYQTRAKSNIKKATPSQYKKTIQSSKKVPQIDKEPVNNRNLRQRTRSMGSLSRGESTPKKSKVNEKKASSERKPYLRSDSKKQSIGSTPKAIDLTNNNKLSVVAKNLSGQLDNCDVNSILAEQLRIERMIAQEKKDMEFAKSIDAELNGHKMRGARTSVKRQMTLNYALRPAKKLKV